jgi:DNA repair protein RecN (Recombination protein N)
MLKNLLIRNFTIAPTLELDFAEGFTAITGETGAGKSILVDAMSLLTGQRADSGAVRSEAEKAELSACFELPQGSLPLDWLRNADLDAGEDCLLRRVISAGGRSRAWINGSPVTLQQLQELGDLLVEIHGQNEHIKLNQRSAQFRLLDESGGYGQELEAVASAHRNWNELRQAHDSLLAESPMDDRDLDLLRFQLQELESACLSSEEFNTLETEHRRLAQGSVILQALDQAQETLESERSGIGDSIHLAIAALQDHAGLDEDIEAAVQMLREAQINCEEARVSLQTARSKMDLSPARLETVTRQLNTLHDLARKHHAQPEELDAVIERLAERLDRASSLDSRITEVRVELEASLEDYGAAAEHLHSARTKHAQALSKQVTILMQELGMEGGQFRIEVFNNTDGQPSPRGGDVLELLVSANPGTPPGPLRKVASGGELSRISLAIKVASMGGEPAPTQVFDEVDAGIGGETAYAVGRLLKSLSGSGQALCVTHLAQVAVCADQQFQVIKTADDQATQVSTSLLDGSGRIDEIARMLGGRVSDQSRAHASELLATAAGDN